ncbi:cardiolipin synthase [Solibacillus sp. FSL W7-1472]|uniref:Cardiolipin synthase n=1 Tax=Solibacillus silvestris (strain StLB046) TaxID=1002809 RepID=F2F6D2_SOLSS|nr:cardiolipin synthase [Solibacillus silvestris]OBW59566.1 cardiolipin synthase [Solibacillus silvestris]BAK14826.1 phosphatidylserine/phosphatidylglycerophosphate/cardiolipin synthase [Solibacillus silvestris StLB046]
MNLLSAITQSSILVPLIMFINILFALTVIFLERKKPSSTWAWLLVLFFLPFVGFFLYLLLGRQLRKKHLFRWDGRKDIGIEQLISYQIEAIENNELELRVEHIKSYNHLIYMNLKTNNAVLTQDNDVKIFVDGSDKFEALINDISHAKNHIHIQYYIFKLDNLGQRIVNALIKKAKQGVKVRVLFDEMGSRGVRKRHFKELIEAGGEVEVFFPSILPLINPRLNFRNHRKISIIDGRIGYIGGFNVGDEYLSLSDRFGYWRDTHLRIEGSAVHPLQTRFILDWNQASAKNDICYAERYFPIIPQKGTAALQIISSGPDTEWEVIKNNYLHLITNAKKYVYIQSPYFIPDESFFDAIRIAALSGIDVRIMIPNKPDHLFVYWATYSYVGPLVEAGAKVYHYEKGFIHAKMIVVDDEIASVGTANIDVRSFSLNFEVNALLYDRLLAHRLAEIFESDILDCSELTFELYKNRSNFIKFKESISRLLSPIL